MAKKTTVKVGKKIVLELNKLKVHPRQSNEEIIKMLLEEHNEKEK